MIYILRSSGAIGTDNHRASYYVGYADEDKFMKRINAHIRGKGSHFTKECIRRGHSLMVMAIIEGSRDDERLIKNRKDTAKIVDMIQRGKTPRCIKGRVIFCQPKSWLEVSPYGTEIFPFSMITL